MSGFGFHYKISLKKREGIYHVRLYDMPATEPQSIFAPGSMENHKFNKLQYVPEVKLPEDCLLQIGENAVALDNEFLDGAPLYKTLKLNFAACKELRDVVSAARDKNREVWCEVVLEQWITDAGTPEYAQMIAPRKKRLYYWGKLVKNQLKGSVKTQSFANRYLKRFGMIRRWLSHKGTLEMSFTHWLKVRGSVPVTVLLDNIRNGAPPPTPFIPTPENTISISELFYRIITQVNPTSLFACADHRLTHNDGLGDSVNSVSHCNFAMSNTFTGGGLIAKSLNQLEIIVRQSALAGFTPAFSPLFDNVVKDMSEFSLYKCKDLNELLVRLSDEFGYKFQAELPTIDEIAKRSFPVNNENGRKQNWPSTARWVFLDIDDPFVDLDPRPLEGTIDYYPAALWVKKITVNQPTGKDSWHGKAEWESIYEGGETISKTLLFRFFAKKKAWVAGAYTDVDDLRGIELYIRSDVSPFQSVVRLATRDGNTFYDSWAGYHVMMIFNRWGSVRSTLEFESFQVGIEPFGANNLIKPVKHFRLHDFGDFPVLRRFIASFGLLFDDNAAGDYSVFDISRTPGGNTKLRAIEKQEYASIDITEDEVPDDPENPPEDVPPPPHSIITPLTGSTQSGPAVMLAGTVTNTTLNPYKIEMYVGGAYVGDATITGGGNAFNKVINSLLFADGSYTVEARCYNAHGAWTSSFITIKIDN
jgi:hypothetical protein